MYRQFSKRACKPDVITKHQRSMSYSMESQAPFEARDDRTLIKSHEEMNECNGLESNYNTICN